MLLTKLILIAIVALTVAQAHSIIAWATRESGTHWVRRACFIAVPLIYLIWRLDLNGNRS